MIGHCHILQYCQRRGGSLLRVLKYTSYKLGAFMLRKTGNILSVKGDTSCILSDISADNIEKR